MLGGLVVAAGVYALFGGFFVPIGVVVEDPEVVSAPESWVAIWIILVGLLMTVWPAGRPDQDS